MRGGDHCLAGIVGAYALSRPTSVVVRPDTVRAGKPRAQGELECVR